VTSAVHQAVCSPVRNPVYVPVQKADLFARTRAGRASAAAHAVGPRAAAAGRLGDRQGPWFNNMIGAVELEGRSSVFRLERTVAGDDEPLESSSSSASPRERSTGPVRR
jgi:hypothetical protein